MSNTYKESIHFVGPAEQIRLVPAHLDIEAWAGANWLHVPYDTYYNVGPIEELSESTFRISVFVRLAGSPLDDYFEDLSRVLPNLLLVGSSYCPHMCELNLECWFGGQPILSFSLPLFYSKQRFIPDVATLEDSILTDLGKSMNEVLTTAEASFASGCKTPRKALRKLEQIKAHWDSYKSPDPDAL